MADDVQLNPGSGGAVLATDEDGSNRHYQLIKLVYGGLDTFTLVSTGSPLPVDLRLDTLAGNLDVNLAASGITLPISGTVTANVGTGTMTVQPTATLVDDAAFSPGATPVVMAGATFDDVTPDTVNEGDAGAVRMSARRELYVQVRDAAGNERGLNIDATGGLAVSDGGGSLTVDNAALAVVGGGPEATAQRVTLANNSTGLLAVTNAALAVVGGGPEATAQRVTLATDSTGVLSVDDNNASLTIDNATLAVTGGGTETGALRVTLANNSTGVLTTVVSSLPNEGQQTMANSISVAVASDQGNLPVSQATAASLNAQVVGDVAHDGADTGNPVKIGAQARTTLPVAVGDADRVTLIADKLGRLLFDAGQPRELVEQNRIVLTSTAETSLLAAVGAGIFLDLTSLDISNESATEVRIDIRDTTGGTVRWSIDLAADGGGVVKTWERNPFKQASANANWTAQLSAAVSSVYITAQAERST